MEREGKIAIRRREMLKEGSGQLNRKTREKEGSRSFVNGKRQ